MQPCERQSLKKQQTGTSLEKDQQILNKDFEILQKDIESKTQTVQISSAQAQLYFQYLRKKISYQTNDPFSIPFLNLKFQQLDSWKGATQQLNLDSKIYGMRVDNCHDNTLKMLNYVIRNQQHQNERVTGAAQKQVIKEDQIHKNHLPKSNHNFYLQKSEKINGKFDIAMQLQNVSFWRTVFKKSQTLNHIQLNTIELSSDLSLEIDLKKINYKSGQSRSSNFINETELEINKGVMKNFDYINEQLKIFKEIEIIKKELSEQIDQFVQRRRKENEQQGQNHIENPLQEMNLGLREIHFSQFYDYFNQFELNYQEGNAISQNQTFFPQFEEETNQNVFPPNIHQLKSILIEPIDENYSKYEFANDEDNFQTDLYQPQKDIFFNSTFKKARRPGTKIIRKIIRMDESNVDFRNIPILIDRNKAFKKESSKMNNLRNDNLVPISYVVIYESRNPFKKMKKVHKNNCKTNIYDSNNHFQQIEKQQMIRAFNQIRVNRISEMHEQMNFDGNQNQFEKDEENLQGQNYLIHVPIKAVKEEIMKEIKNCDRNIILSKPFNMNDQQQSEKLDQTSYMDTYLQQEASMISLKFLKAKMKTCDPLDILVSLLHVAFEEQVILQPLYFQNVQTNIGDDLILKDILIQADQYY